MKMEDILHVLKEHILDLPDGLESNLEFKWPCLKIVVTLVLKYKQNQLFVNLTQRVFSKRKQKKI